MTCDARDGAELDGSAPAVQRSTMTPWTKRAVAPLAVLVVLAPALAATGCGAGEAAPAVEPAPTPSATASDGASDPFAAPGTSVEIAGFAETPVYFTGTENRRTVDASASFPERGAFESITLTLTLGCPSKKCDAWDRAGTIGLVLSEGGPGPEDDVVVELARFMTPYGVGGSWTVDLTDLRPLLVGERKLRGFIDTWVGPGHAQGNGWLLTASFSMRGGKPAREPVAAIPLWQRAVDGVAVGDPQKPLAASLKELELTLPVAGRPASSVAVRSFVTGHGQGNANNCAEFCKLTHTVGVGAERVSSEIWRADCRATGAPGQQGSWTASRAGWCPGADVRPWTADFVAVDPAALAGKAPLRVSYAVGAYENTCRPDACTASTCAFGQTTCGYDGGMHTEPSVRVSSVLVAYR